MFVANVITAWVEALEAVFGSPDYPNNDLADFQMKDIPILTEYPQEEVNYPGLWVNFSMQGDVKNVGIGHVEYADDPGGFREVFRWHFGGFVEITVGALGNLERALLLDEVTKTIAVARADKNDQGILRKTIDQHDLIGLRVAWESLTISGFSEAQGTPWGTDDPLYEATVTITLEGEVVLDPQTGVLVPLASVSSEPLLEGDLNLPTVGVDGWT